MAQGSKCDFWEIWGQNVILEVWWSKCDFWEIWGQDVILRSFVSKCDFGKFWDQVWAWIWFNMDWNV